MREGTKLRWKKGRIRKEEKEGENKKVSLFCQCLYCSQNHRSMKTDVGLEGCSETPSLMFQDLRFFLI
jgi:hypothetical protein